MTTLNDTQKSSAVDFAQIERLVWGYQDGTISLAETISHGTIGIYAIKVVEYPNLRDMSNGETKKDAPHLRHMVLALREQREYSGEIYAATGESVPVETKKAVNISKSPLAQVRAFDRLFSSKMKDASHLNNWQNYWRVAYAEKTGFLAGRDLADYRKDYGLESPEKWQFVRANFQTHNPTQLRAEWQKTREAKNEQVKAKAAEKPAPKRKASKAKTTPKNEGVPSLAVALAENGK